MTGGSLSFSLMLSLSNLISNRTHWGVGLHPQSRMPHRIRKDGEGERRIALKKKGGGGGCCLNVTWRSAVLQREGHRVRVRQPRQNTPSDSAQAEQMDILTQHFKPPPPHSQFPLVWLHLSIDVNFPGVWTIGWNLRWHLTKRHIHDPFSFNCCSFQSESGRRAPSADHQSITGQTPITHSFHNLGSPIN